MTDIVVTVDILGLARELARARSCDISLEHGATFRDLLAGLSSQFPLFLGPIIHPQTRELTASYMLNVGGRAMVTDLDQPVPEDQNILLMFAEAGG